MASLGRVLVIDDEVEVALLLHDALTVFGYTAKMAVTGPEGLSEWTQLFLNHGDYC